MIKIFLVVGNGETESILKSIVRVVKEGNFIDIDILLEHYSFTVITRKL